MLTKQELTKKKAESQQLDLVNTISAEVKLRRKRIFLFITIFLTIGLSLAFWIYRAFKTTRFEFTLPSLPSLPELSSPKVPPLDSRITKIISSDAGWSITLGLSPLYNWSKNREVLGQPELGTIYQELSAMPPTPDSRIRQYLPEGLTIKERFESHDNSYSLKALVITPQKELLMVFSAASISEDTFSQTLSRLAPALYWESTL